jgi:hypothetical protein
MLISLCLSKGILYLQDNAAPHTAAITHQKSADLHLEVLKHTVYSPDLAPSDNCLFPKVFIKPKTYQPPFPRIVKCRLLIARKRICVSKLSVEGGCIGQRLKRNAHLQTKARTYSAISIQWPAHHTYPVDLPVSSDAKALVPTLIVTTAALNSPPHSAGRRGTTVGKLGVHYRFVPISTQQLSKAHSHLTV